MLVYLAKQIEQYGRQWNAATSTSRFHKGRAAREVISSEKELFRPTQTTSANTPMKGPSILPERPDGSPGAEGGRRAIFARRTHHSATTIQSQWRGSKARTRVKNRHSAASKIQSLHRGGRARIQVQIQRDQYCGAMHIQRLHRGRASRRREKQKHSSATKLQALRRGHVTRRHHRKRHQAAASIQAVHRGRRTRAQARVSRKEESQGQEGGEVTTSVNRGEDSREDRSHSTSTIVVQQHGTILRQTRVETGQ